MKRYALLTLLLFACGQIVLAQTHLQILDEFKNPTSKTVLVASHRGDWRNFAENSIEGIKSCINMGVDIIELDVARTKDGELVLMHDNTVDRTTNGSGKVEEHTLAEIKLLRLKNGLGRVTKYSVPTLAEAINVIKGKILVNLDKSDLYFDQVYSILEQTGTLTQVIIKSTEPYDSLYSRFGEPLTKMIYMPNVKLWNEGALDAVDNYSKHGFYAFEIGFDAKTAALLPSLQALVDGKSRIWFNSLWESQSAGYCDDNAVDDMDGNWGALIERGATIIQTDRPQALLNYLNSKGMHK